MSVGLFVRRLARSVRAQFRIFPSTLHTQHARVHDWIHRRWIAHARGKVSPLATPANITATPMLASVHEAFFPRGCA